ncbi:MAG: GIY-YIG nuclease family protein [Candidatus Peregrinibacteria bacterium]
MKDYYVYILLCADGSYYTGVTNDYERRVGEHQAGADPKSYTHRRRPVQLVYVGIFGDINEAISWEKRVKRWSRRKKEALISQDWNQLPALSSCQNSSANWREVKMRRIRYRVRRIAYETLIA